METFEEMSLDAKIMKKLAELKFTSPTPIQKVALPIGLSNRDGLTK